MADESGKYKPGSDYDQSTIGPGTSPREVRLGVEYDQIGDPGKDKLDKLYDQISGYMRQLDAIIGKDGYSVDREGRITIKTAASNDDRKTILLIEDVLISLFRRKEFLESK